MKPYSFVYYTVAATALFCAVAAQAQTPDFGKSYINVTKGNSGGTVETGDTLEIRASFVARSGTFDSCAYFDVVPAGTAYIPGTVRVLTNEGKIYKQFTDAITDDEGFINGANIRINLGYNQTASPANRFRRGRIANTHRPSFYGGSCIMIASFRVRITAATGSIISIGGGSMTYKLSTAALQTYTFPQNQVAVYTNFGICSNTVGVNSLGTEFNGTFGSGKKRNRGTSGNVPVGYTYNTFTTNSPQDYYYGVANNTSTQNYSTSNSWAIPDNSSPSHRVFNVWDIIGDHTGAASLSAGNSAADTVASSNGGYMLVINAAYRIDSAFQHTISGLCPNTYYEISCWMRNICSKCGCDSAGRGASSAGYISTAPGDSSGVRPNITFEVDGVDYYTTGNLLHTGQWVKKGFTFRTGPTQSSFTLKFFNNAPGGGGNDWALDDISVATCSPDLIFTPSNNPVFCRNDVANIGCIVKSYFNNYTNYKWQKSTDGGTTWANSGTAATGSPTWNGTEWEYNISYPPFVVTAADSGTKFKVIVATTAANLSNTSCAFSEVGSVITLNIIDCGPPLTTQILSFTASRKKENDILHWIVGKETEVVKYVAEKSSDGKLFSSIATFESDGDTTAGTTYTCTSINDERVWYYRIKMVYKSGAIRYSSISKLGVTGTEVPQVNITNPFTNEIIIDGKDLPAGEIDLSLFNESGHLIRFQKHTLTAANNQFFIKDTKALPNGFYTIQIKTATALITKKLVKLSY